MTTKAYLQLKLAKFGICEEEIQLIILENELSENEEVDILQAKMAMYKSFSQWLPLHSQITEGGVTEAWNFEAIRLYYNLLCKELDKENVLQSVESKNEIVDKSNIW